MRNALLARIACLLANLQKFVCKSVLHLSIMPEVHQILADGDKGFEVTREKHILLLLCIEDAPHLAIILQLLQVTNQGLLLFLP